MFGDICAVTVVYGVNFELSYETPPFSETRFALEVRPIIGVRNKEWEFIVNPIIDVGFGSQGETDFLPAARLARNLGEDRFIGLEYYSDLGRIGNFLPLQEQRHQIFAVTDFKLGVFDIDLGIGYGLTPGSDRRADILFRLLAGGVEAIALTIDVDRRLSSYGVGFDNTRFAEQADYPRASTPPANWQKRNLAPPAAPPPSRARGDDQVSERGAVMQLSNRGAVEADPLARQRPVDLDAPAQRLHPASELAKKKSRAASSAAPLACC